MILGPWSCTITPTVQPLTSTAHTDQECYRADGTSTNQYQANSQSQAHRLGLKFRVPVGVAAIPAVTPAALQGGGKLLVLAPKLADGAPQVEHQLVLRVQDAEGVALHPESHAGKVKCVQRLLCMSLQQCI